MTKVFQNYLPTGCICEKYIAGSCALLCITGKNSPGSRQITLVKKLENCD